MTAVAVNVDHVFTRALQVRLRALLLRALPVQGGAALDIVALCERIWYGHVKHEYDFSGCVFECAKEGPRQP